MRQGSQLTDTQIVHAVHTAHSNAGKSHIGFFSGVDEWIEAK